MTDRGTKVRTVTARGPLGWARRAMTRRSTVGQKTIIVPVLGQYRRASGTVLVAPRAERRAAQRADRAAARRARRAER